MEPLVAELKRVHDPHTPGRGESDLRRLAGIALGQIGDARAVELLKAALEDKALRQYAARAVGQIADPGRRAARGRAFSRPS
ncbi:MAG: HEAT repeat domain-containing protein [bacterium]